MPTITLDSIPNEKWILEVKKIGRYNISVLKFSIPEELGDIGETAEEKILERERDNLLSWAKELPPYVVRKRRKNAKKA